jgi:hypothetical protein
MCYLAGFKLINFNYSASILMFVYLALQYLNMQKSQKLRQPIYR